MAVKLGNDVPPNEYVDYEGMYNELLEAVRPSKFMDKATREEAHAQALRSARTTRAMLDAAWELVKRLKPGIKVSDLAALAGL